MDRFGELSLVSMAKAGDQEALTVLFDTHKDKVYGHAIKKLGSHQDAEDVVQEVFLKVWQSLQNFQDGRDLGAWIFGICANTVADHLRRHYRSRNREKELLFIYESNEEIMTDLDDENLIQEILSDLSENHRSVLILSNLQGRSRGEIAKILFNGDTPETRKKVSDLLYRASEAAKKLSDRANG
jgi:RNA polymerase sigma-70 factor, ECF subfamily